LGGVNTNIGNEVFKDEKASFKVAVLLQNDITHRWVIITNIGYDKLGTESSGLYAILSTTYTLNDKWSTFFELQTIKAGDDSSFKIGSGLAYLFNSNFQLDFSARAYLGEGSGFYVGTGASYRFDKHEDKLKENYGKKKKRGMSNRNFFERLLGLNKYKDYEKIEGGGIDSLGIDTSYVPEKRGFLGFFKGKRKRRKEAEAASLEDIDEELDDLEYELQLLEDEDLEMDDLSPKQRRRLERKRAREKRVEQYDQEEDAYFDEEIEKLKKELEELEVSMPRLSIPPPSIFS